MLGACNVVGGPYVSPRRKFPEAAGIWLFCSGCLPGVVGGSGIGGGGADRSARPISPLCRLDEGGDGLGADLSGVGVARNRLQSVEVVAGDNVGDFLAILGERAAQVLSDREVAGLAVSP